MASSSLFSNTPRSWLERVRRAVSRNRRDGYELEALVEKAGGGFGPASLRELAKVIVAPKTPARLRAGAVDRAARVLGHMGGEENIQLALALLQTTRSGLRRDRSPYPVLEADLLLKAGDPLAASRILDRSTKPHQDCLFLQANCIAAFCRGLPLEPGEGDTNGDSGRLEWINAALALNGLSPIRLFNPEERLTLDNITAKSPSRRDDGPLISVIMPSYNSAAFLRSSVRSILEQSWRNFELIIVDDASTDSGRAILDEFAETDRRIKVIHLEVQSGPYVARNRALQIASGEFVTCQDADDWSHPGRLETQARHLIENPGFVANATQWARCDANLWFIRRALAHKVAHLNSSSLMFRRKPVLEKIGYWDSVRFAGDTEFIHRLTTVFGERSMKTLPGAYAFGRAREDSLSRVAGSRYEGGKVGTRKAYADAYTLWHRRGKANPKLMKVAFPPAEPPFAAPTLIRTGSREKRHYDVVILSDFRHFGGNGVSSLEEVYAQSRAGLKTAIVQVAHFEFRGDRPINPLMQEAFNKGLADPVAYDEEISADLAIVRYPPIFQEKNPFLPRINAEHVRVVVNQPPRRTSVEPPFYSVERCAESIDAYFGRKAIWVPIGPAVREAFAADGEAHHLASEDWINIIDVAAWRRDKPAWLSDRPVIGRHSRDHSSKWPASKEQMLAAYPLSGEFEVKILGGANSAVEVLGSKPRNWRIHEFGAMPPADFLAQLDFFIYFPHEARIEAFGRTIIEAMASGTLAIIPPVFEPLFKDAAIYTQPEGVHDTVLRFYRDRPAYDRQVEKALDFVRANFGYEKHIARLGAFVAALKRS